ncbi:MAG TPA: DUF4384 domain-containing protein [Candidatus Competibacter sp.]|nr:DUF4384 domain-containing protein [Candidatus Competibacter sp.]HRX62889.1 DUF4384 domain-containing protein [Candidatus Competibacter sp.]
MHNRLSHLQRTLTALFVVGSIVLSASTARAQELTSKDLIPVQRPMAELTPPPPRPRPNVASSDLQVTAWVDHADNTYAFGEKVVLSVKTNHDAYLTIVDVGTSGRVHILFPNRFQTNNRIQAGQTFQVPDPRADFDFRVDGPAGTELIKVFASQDPAPLFKEGDTEPAGPFKALKANAPAVAKDLQVVLREPRHRDWDAYNKIIRIVPR